MQSSKKRPQKAANYSVIEQNALSDKHPKMTSQNDRPDESLTGQAHDQAGHCPLTGRYFEPWSICLEYLSNVDFERKTID